MKNEENNTFSIKGVYIHDGFVFEPKKLCPYYWNLDDWKKVIDWFSFLGLDTLEFATQAEFLRIPSTKIENDKVAKMRKVIDYAHTKRMKTYLIVFTNVLSTVPRGEKPAGQLRGRFAHLCPRIGDNFKRTVETNAYFIDKYKNADGFEIFAGDWGGCRCGRCTYQNYLDYVREYHRIIRQLNGKADIFMNLWCIAYWGRSEKNNSGYRWLFDKEILRGKRIMAALNSTPPDVHLAFPCHHLYRPLCRAQYEERKCPEWPDQEVIDKIHGMGRKAIAWPHFIMDDDPYRPATFGRMHSEVRYLMALIKKLAQLRFDGVMGNLYLPKLQLLNTYAFARLCHNPAIGKETILDEFCRLLAPEKDRGKLRSLLIDLENKSGWAGQPPDREKGPFSAAAFKINRSPSPGLFDTPNNFLNNLKIALRR